MNPFWLVFFNWVGSTNNQLNHCKNTFSDVGSDPSQELNTMKHLHGLVDDTVSDGTCKVFTYMNAVKTHRSVGKYTIKGSYSVCVCIHILCLSHPTRVEGICFSIAAGGICRGLSTVQLEPTLLSQNLLLGRSGYRERRTWGHCRRSSCWFRRLRRSAAAFSWWYVIIRIPILE